MDTTSRTKTILCYGDSNTWGFNPYDIQNRYQYEQRWTSILAKGLGPGYQVIPEGLNGRTTVFDDPTVPGRNGAQYLYPCLQSHKPLDLVLVMLGTNDSSYRYGVLAPVIALGMKRLVKIILHSEAGVNNTSPMVGIIAPVPVNSDFDEAMVNRSRHLISKKLSVTYKAIAEELQVQFFDSSAYISECKMPDGIHLHPDDHKILGEQLTVWVTSMFSSPKR